ncbi:MAG: preprotein translocase subunit SecG [Candidatus Woykebacteria bacterium GWB1_45_5]|uniref:Protein-export membrane protein SecG n=1 Tax=Candidatus Woykebacteria bacterium GWB1_45_5 TaxID=1802592 RepID=A0A1G1W854_9BACT|nr:MAG: preprotein translocase subunit SecG [Candidatus Woykebacteria bacterium GWB1_45_5]
MRPFILVLLTVIAISLVALILLQVRGSGVGSIFGGTGEVYRTRRGAEKLLHYTTIALAFLFSAISFCLIFVQ